MFAGWSLMCNGAGLVGDGRGVTDLRCGALFAGGGALELAVHAVTGAVPVWFVENDPGASRVLAARWPGVPNHGDITTVDWDAVGTVDVLTGGFPCTDVSCAGGRAGMRPGTRSGLWSHMAYAISKLQPKLVVIENVRGLLSADAACDLERCPWCVGDDEGRPLRALGGVLGDLANLGFDARWCGVRAADVGAPHGRFRVFIAACPVGDSDGVGGEGWSSAGFEGEAGSSVGSVADPSSAGCGSGSWMGRAVGETAVGDGAPLVADTEGDGWDQGWAESAGFVGGSDVAQRGAGSGWGLYEPAIRRWESVLGRPAPVPTVNGARGGPQLSPVFVEWLMGWPSGWVTGVSGLSRVDQLRILGNGVVPQQAKFALRYLLGPCLREGF